MMVFSDAMVVTAVGHVTDIAPDNLGTRQQDFIVTCGNQATHEPLNLLASAVELGRRQKAPDCAAADGS